MIAQETVQQLQHAPVTDRIQVIEALLESLKHDIAQTEEREAHPAPFRVRTFDLGRDIVCDRDELYAERGI
jgi:hypothetical protein